jgi:hypothetical protein
MIVFLIILAILGLSVWGFFYWLEHGKGGEKLVEVSRANDAKLRADFESQKFKPSKRHTYARKTLLFDRDSNRICLLQKLGFEHEEKFSFSAKYFAHTDILESKIVEDGASVTETSRASQIGGAIVGGMIAGGVGAMIGGLSGKKTTNQTVKSLKLQFIMNSTANPTQEMTFIEDPKGVSKESDYYKGVISNIQDWHNLISVLINKAAKEESEKMPAEPTQVNTETHVSAADEIRKSYELLKEGIITQEEFESQKKKLIG